MNKLTEQLGSIVENQDNGLKLIIVKETGKDLQKVISKLNAMKKTFSEVAATKDDRKIVGKVKREMEAAQKILDRLESTLISYKDEIISRKT